VYYPVLGHLLGHFCCRFEGNKSPGWAATPDRILLSPENQRIFAYFHIEGNRQSDLDCNNCQANGGRKLCIIDEPDQPGACETVLGGISFAGSRQQFSNPLPKAPSLSVSPHNQLANRCNFHLNEYPRTTKYYPVIPSTSAKQADTPLQVTDIATVAASVRESVRVWEQQRNAH
jgi:hypothetical protein